MKAESKEALSGYMSVAGETGAVKSVKGRPGAWVRRLVRRITFAGLTCIVRWGEEDDMKRLSLSLAVMVAQHMHLWPIPLTKGALDSGYEVRLVGVLLDGERLGDWRVLVARKEETWEGTTIRR